MYEELMKFKTKLLNSVESNKIKKLIENYLYAFGTKDGKVNMLLIKHISKKMNYFNRMIKLFKDNTEETCEIIINEDNNDKKQRTENTINEHLKGQSSVTEFLHEIKVGFDMAVKNGPLCEENMYGVIFIVEYVKFKENEEDKKEETPSKSEDNKNDKDESNTLKNANQVTNDPNVQQTQSTSNELSLDNANLVLPKGDKEQDSKSLTSDLSKNKSSVYGPLLGQIMGTVKDCCRKAYLNGDPRLYEGLYLCLFQIKQENVGKIYSVVNKRRGEIINEIPGEENIMSTIEAVVPVAESFGFVEEIRKKSSGLTNPMLRFYKWRIIDVDPFDIISEEDLLNFGENANTMNIAKTYINKIRQRKGLVTDEKIVQGADKQRSLAKKR
jgi:ribosome assembly protein 1